MNAGPWRYEAHVGAWLLVAAMVLTYAWALHRYGPGRATLRQKLSFAGGSVALAVSLSWPVADLARSWSLLAHMVQMSMLLLVAPPLLLLGVPRSLIGTVTRPPALDAVLGRLTRPMVATLIFNAVVIVSLLAPVVEASARSAAVAGVVHLALLVAGVIMWVPALRAFPGPNQLSTPGRIVYLFVQSLLPNFPALVFIFAGHPLYPSLGSHVSALGLSPLADQRMAGALAKLAGIGVLWGTAAGILVRAQRAEEAGKDPDPLAWDDVERELRRLDRRPRRTDAP